VRPYISKWFGQLVNATLLKMKGAIELVKKPIKRHRQVAIDMIATYCSDKPWRKALEDYQNDPIMLSGAATKKWLEKSPYTDKVTKQLKDWLDKDIMMRPLSQTHIIAKIEGILKDEPWDEWVDQKNRIVVWQWYPVAAMFSPIVNKIKTRLKNILNDDVIYLDGMTPLDLSKRVSSKPCGKYFCEDDFSKQDRQTSDDTLRIELNTWALLGLHPDLVRWLSTLHSKWFYKFKEMWGFEKGKRKTGSVFTALGNWHTNLLVHADYYK
jgi:hypothetical protein